MLNKPRYRLPKSEILKKSADFEAVFNGGRRWEGQILKCFYIKADDRKIGFIVPKRLGKAVFRNRFKRLMREVYRHHRHTVGEFWILIMAKNTGKPPVQTELETEFCRFIQKTGLMQ